MSERLVVVKVGYVQMAVPAEVLPFVPQFRPIGWDYSNNVSAYYFSDEDVSVEFKAPDSILPCKPEKAPAPPAAPVLEQEVIPAPPEDGSDGMQAARELIAEAGDFSPMSYVRKERS